MDNSQTVQHIGIDINNNDMGESSRENERFALAIEIGVKYATTIEELASICCQSVSTFKRRFRARYIISPHKWFMLRKLELAHKIITESEVTINELVKLCGYNNTSHFIALFRKQYGISPARLSRQVHNREQTSISHKKED